MTETNAALSGPLAAVTFLGGFAAAAKLSRHPFPRPGSDPESIRRYFRQSPPVPRISQAGQLVSAAALARFGFCVAALARQTRRAPSAVPGLAIAAAGASAATLAASAVSAAALTTNRSDDDEQAQLLARRVFTLGGVLHGPAFGLMTATVALAGSPASRLPARLTRAAYLSAAAGLFAPLYLVNEKAVWLIPIGRFTGLSVITVAGRRMARRARTVGTDVH